MTDGYKIKRVLIWQGGEEKQIYPATWKPNANTLLYLPLESDFVDRSGQATTRVFTTSGLSYTTVGNIPSVHVGSGGGAKLTTPYPLQRDATKPFTVSVLVYNTTLQSSSRRCIMELVAINYSRVCFRFEENTTNVNLFNQGGSSVSADYTNYINKWTHIVVTGSAGNKRKMYLNGELKSTGADNLVKPRGERPYSRDNYQGIFTNRNSYFDEGLNGNARELIVEEAEWNASDVSNYYNWIKGKLGF